MADDKIKLDEIEIIMIKGLNALENEVKQVIAKFQEDSAKVIGFITGNHDLAADAIGKDYGIDLAGGYLVPVPKPEPSPESKAVPPATFDPEDPSLPPPQ